MKAISRFLISFLDFILPNNCYRCNRRLENKEKYFCSDCISGFKYANDYKYSPTDETTSKVLNNLDNIISLIYFIENDISRDIIHTIKYDGILGLGKKMGNMLGEKLIEYGKHYDLLIPVPLHKTKKKERGYNQSEIIAVGVSETLKIPLNINILQRTRYTESQTRLTREGRINNTEGAFDVNPKITETIKNAKILLLDDVITTGSTMNACAGKLKENGAKSVTGVSLALVREN